MIPQSTIDNFKRDPLGSVTAMVNDPKSILKNINIQIPDSVKSVKDLVASVADGDKIVETTEPSRRSTSPSVKTVVEMPPVPVKDLTPPPPPEPEPERYVDAGVIVAKDETKTSGPTLIEIKPEDLEAIKAFMDSRNVHHVILQ